MQIREYLEEEDYLIARDWWISHGQPPIAEHMLPETGVTIVSDNGLPLLCSFLLLTNASVAFLTFTVADAELPWEVRAKAQELAFYALKELAREADVTTLVSISENGRLTEKLENSGMAVVDGATVLLEVLGQTNGVTYG